MHAPLSQAALLLLATAWLSLQSTAQLSVTVHVPLYKAAPILLAACHSSLTAAQLAVVRGEDDGDVDDEDDQGVEDDADDEEDEDEDKDEDGDEADEEDNAVEDSAPQPSSSVSANVGDAIDNATVDPAAPKLSCPDTFDQSTQIDSSATLYYAVVPSNPEGSGNGLLCGRLEAENDGWIGIGFSSDGSMDGSQAVIGVPAEGTVLKYDLTSTATLMSEDKQTLSGTSITEVEGMVVMEFAKLLIEGGEVPILEGADNNVIHARGQGNLGFHSNGYMSLVVSFRAPANAPADAPADDTVDATVSATVSATADASIDATVGSTVSGTVDAIADATVDPASSQLSCSDTLDQSTEIDSSATLYYTLENGFLRGRLEVENDGWIGIGFSSDGTMYGSQAVIGIPAEGTVLKYDLTSTATLMSDDRQTLSGTSISEVEGIMIMEFTKLLIEEGEVPILEGVENNFIHARGQGALGFHSIDYSFRVDLCTSAIGEDVDEVVDLDGGDGVATSALVVDAQGFKDCTKEMCEYQLSADFLLKYQINVPSDTTSEMCEKCTISMEAIYDGEAWVSIAVSTDGMMIGSEAVIGIPGEVPQKYYLSSKSNDGAVPMPESAQTLTDASVEVIDQQTIMKFTKVMKEAGEIEITSRENIFLWAYGSSDVLGKHLGRSLFDLNLSSGSVEEVKVPNMSAWLAHGILAFFAWGVLVPLAVNSSLFRDLLPKGPLWFNLHRAFNTAAFALFVALFSIAVSYTMKEGVDHFDNDHQQMGLAMFILTTVQVMGGVFRPHLPEPGSVGKKTKFRKRWEGGHRLFGAALLACGFWQISDGIKLFSRKYSVSENNEDKVCIAYWVWIGVVSATIILGIWYSKIRKGIPDDPSKASRAVNVTDSGGLDTDSGIVIPRDPPSNDES